MNEQKYSRRNFLTMLGVGAGAFYVTSATGMRYAAGAEPSEKRPNIIVILADDMGFSDLGCYGGEMETPNLNRLAAKGLRFTEFHNTARCCPSRASLLTGLYPHQAAIGHMTDDKQLDGYQGDLSRQAVTLAEVMRAAGYGTYMAGKWHVTKHCTPQGPKENWPLQRGFNRFYGTIAGAGSFFDPGTLTRDNTMISPFADPQYKPETFYYTNAITHHAVQFIDDHCNKISNQPFFMYVAYTAAHWPMHALEEDITRFKGKYDGGYEPIRKRRYERLKEMGLIHKDWDLSNQEGDWNQVADKKWEARCMEVYAAMIYRMDQGIGQIVEELEKQKQLDNTLIFFLQDNGACQESIGRHGKAIRPAKPTLSPIPPDVIRLDVIPKQNRQGIATLQGPGIMPGPEDTFISYGINWANVSNTPFRYYKHFVHEGGISTPLIAHWPAGIKSKGKLDHQPGHLIDIMATCVDVGCAKYPVEFKGNTIQPMEGCSLTPAFDGKPIQRTNALFWEHEGNRAIRTADQWKLVAKGPRGPWELYNMDKDRTEMHDLAEKMTDKVKEMAALWEDYAKRTHAIPWPWGKPYGTDVNLNT